MPIIVDLRSIKAKFMFIIKQVKDQCFQYGFIFFIMDFIICIHFSTVVTVHFPLALLLNTVKDAPLPTLASA
jgi:hypothetical protein